jgi:hypothetical protein
VVGGVALAGAALAGALAHVCSKKRWDIRWPVLAAVPVIVAYYREGEDLELVGERLGQMAETLRLTTPVLTEIKSTQIDASRHSRQ